MCTTYSCNNAQGEPRASMNVLRYRATNMGTCVNIRVLQVPGTYRLNSRSTREPNMWKENEKNKKVHQSVDS